MAPGGSGSGGGGHSIPTGHWRDGLCDCCTFGICYPVLCLGIWCRMCLLGQVLTRNKLNWFATPNGPRINATTYQIWFVLMVVSIVLGATGHLLDNDSAAAIILIIITAAISLVRCITTCRARKYLRNKYNIDEQNCNGCEDLCCAWFCYPCTICQMARHTADYHQYKAEYCTHTGLSLDSPEII
jgi:Cys-rich protein (TIGR01571 family)